MKHLRWAPSALVALAIAVTSASPVGAASTAIDENLTPKGASIRLTPMALEATVEGGLEVASVGAAHQTETRSFVLPVAKVIFKPNGVVKAIRMRGGIDISGGTGGTELRKLRLAIPAQRASVKVPGEPLRAPLFGLVRVKQTKNKVSAVLVIAPGASAFLNAQLDTYVFTDGMRFARFTSRRLAR